MDRDQRDLDKVCIVAASDAWPFYRLTGAYVCQPMRSFQDAGWMGFYSGRTIHSSVARIRHVIPSCELSQDQAAVWALGLDPQERRAGEVCAAALQAAWTSETVQIVLLSRPDDPETVSLEPVEHHGRSAWTLFQRYTSLERLRSARSTDDLSGPGENT